MAKAFPRGHTSPGAKREAEDNGKRGKEQNARTKEEVWAAENCTSKQRLCTIGPCMYKPREVQPQIAEYRPPAISSKPPKLCPNAEFESRCVKIKGCPALRGEPPSD